MEERYRTVQRSVDYLTSFSVRLNNTRDAEPKAKPAWRDASPIEKLAEAYDTIERLNGKIFTLRLRKDVHERVVAAKDPCRLIYKRIQRSFGAGGLEVPLHAFFLEVTRDHRNELHLHGAIVLGSLPLHIVKEALRAAGGTVGGPAAPRQVDIMNFDFDRGGPAGWAHYPRKALARTRRVIQHNRVTYIHSRLRRMCKMQWEQRRRRTGGHDW
jgi:hypothetical protein